MIILRLVVLLMTLIVVVSPPLLPDSLPRLPPSEKWRKKKQYSLLDCYM